MPTPLTPGKRSGAKKAMSSTFSKSPFQSESMDPRQAAIPLKAEARRPKLVNSGVHSSKLQQPSPSLSSQNQQTVKAETQAKGGSDGPPSAQAPSTASHNGGTTKAPLSLAQRLLAEAQGMKPQPKNSPKVDPQNSARQSSSSSLGDPQASLLPPPAGGASRAGAVSRGTSQNPSSAAAAKDPILSGGASAPASPREGAPGRRSASKSVAPPPQPPPASVPASSSASAPSHIPHPHQTSSHPATSVSGTPSPRMTPDSHAGLAAGASSSSRFVGEPTHPQQSTVAHRKSPHQGPVPFHKTSIGKSSSPWLGGGNGVRPVPPLATPHPAYSHAASTVLAGAAAPSSVPGASGGGPAKRSPTLPHQNSPGLGPALPSGSLSAAAVAQQRLQHQRAKLEGMAGGTTARPNPNSGLRGPSNQLLGSSGQPRPYSHLHLSAGRKRSHGNRGVGGGRGSPVVPGALPNTSPLMGPRGPLQGGLPSSSGVPSSTSNGYLLSNQSHLHSQVSKDSPYSQPPPGLSPGIGPGSKKAGRGRPSSPPFMLSPANPAQQYHHSVSLNPPRPSGYPMSLGARKRDRRPNQQYNHSVGAHQMMPVHSTHAQLAAGGNGPAGAHQPVPGQGGPASFMHLKRGGSAFRTYEAKSDKRMKVEGGGSSLGQPHGQLSSAGWSTPHVQNHLHHSGGHMMGSGGGSQATMGSGAGPPHPHGGALPPGSVNSHGGPPLSAVPFDTHGPPGHPHSSAHVGSQGHPLPAHTHSQGKPGHTPQHRQELMPVAVVAWRTARPIHKLNAVPTRPKLWTQEAQKIYSELVQPLLDGQWQDTGPKSYPFTAPLGAQDVVHDFQEIQKTVHLMNSFPQFIDFAIPPASANLIPPPPMKHHYYHKTHGLAYSLDYLSPAYVQKQGSQNYAHVSVLGDQVESDDAPSPVPNSPWLVELTLKDLSTAVVQREALEVKYASYRDRFIKENKRKQEEEQIQESILNVLRQCCRAKGRVSAIKRKRNHILSDVARGLRVRAALLGQLAHDNIRLQDRMVHCGLMDGKPRRRTAVSQHDLLAASAQRRSRQVAAARVVAPGAAVTTAYGMGEVVQVRKREGIVQVQLAFGTAYAPISAVEACPLTPQQKQAAVDKLRHAWDHLQALLDRQMAAVVDAQSVLSTSPLDAINATGALAKENLSRSVSAASDFEGRGGASSRASSRGSSPVSMTKGGSGLLCEPAEFPSLGPEREVEEALPRSGRRLRQTSNTESDSEVDTEGSTKSRRVRRKTARAQESARQGRGTPTGNPSRQSPAGSEMDSQHAQSTSGSRQRPTADKKALPLLPYAPFTFGARPRGCWVNARTHVVSVLSASPDYFAGVIFPPDSNRKKTYNRMPEVDFHNFREWEDSFIDAQRMRGDILRLESFTKMKGEALTEMDKMLDQVRQTKNKLQAQIKEPGSLQETQSEKACLKECDPKRRISRGESGEITTDKSAHSDAESDHHPTSDVDYRPPRPPRRKDHDVNEKPEKWSKNLRSKKASHNR